MTAHGEKAKTPSTNKPLLSIEGARELRIARSGSTGMYVPEIDNSGLLVDGVEPLPNSRAFINDKRLAASGFTLLEILIALFIFAILSLLLSNALHNIIGVQSRTEQNAERLHETQLALLLMSRDITQTVNRSVQVANGAGEATFVGKPTGFTFTHAGVSNADGRFMRSNLARVSYFMNGKTLWRNTWAVLDQAPQSAPLKRALLTNLDSANFQYLDSKNVFHAEWPPKDNPKDALPRAVKMNLVINKWGKLSQLYVIPAEPTNIANVKQQPPTTSKPNEDDAQSASKQTATSERH